MKSVRAKIWKRGVGGLNGDSSLGARPATGTCKKDEKGRGGQIFVTSFMNGPLPDKDDLSLPMTGRNGRNWYEVVGTANDKINKC